MTIHVDQPEAALLTTGEAAEYTLVTAATVRGWDRHGHIKPAEYDANGHPLYLAIDVLKAERATRREPRGRRRAAASA